MPERVYTNRVPGQERIYVELTPPEIEAVLRDFAVRPGTSDTTLALLRILVDAKEGFAGGQAPRAGDSPDVRGRLHEHVANAVRRNLRLRLGPNALGMAQRREALALSGGEADQVADIVLDVLLPLICGASAEGFASGLLGPCVLRQHHEGPVHQGPNGEKWLRREDVPRTGREVVHGCPADGSGVTTCCGMAPFELPRTDRLSMFAADVTCPARATHTDGQTV